MPENSAETDLQSHRERKIISNALVYSSYWLRIPSLYDNNKRNRYKSSVCYAHLGQIRRTASKSKSNGSPTQSSVHVVFISQHSLQLTLLLSYPWPDLTVESKPYLTSTHLPRSWSTKHLLSFRSILGSRNDYGVFD